MTDPDGPSTVEESLREIVATDRARLVGALTRWCGDLQLAEDAFGDALVSALATWPSNPPVNGRAWIITAARNRIRDVLKSSAVRTSADLSDQVTSSLRLPAAPTRDDTLALLFACVHPALDRSVHAPLVLQVALGVETTAIAAAFGLPVATLSKRLVRAKQKLRVNRAAFEIPARIDPGRVQAVLDAIYAAYAVDWFRVSAPDAVERVVDEAVHASQLLLRECPENHEVRGLAALLLFLHARGEARVPAGVLVPLDEQDARLWDQHLIDRGNRILRGGFDLPREGGLGPYELQAAIQSAHTSRTDDTPTPWVVIAQLYDALVATTPSLGAHVARAVAVARAVSPAAGLAILEALRRSHPTLEEFQPFHAALGALLRDNGQTEAARTSLHKALDLCTHPPSCTYLRRALNELRTASTIHT